MWQTTTLGLHLALLLTNCQSVNLAIQDRLPYEVRFIKSGGIRGAINQLDIDITGNVSFKKNQVQSANDLTKDELSILKELILAIDTTNLQPEYRSAGKTYDGFKYRLTLGSTTTVMDERSVPDHLQELVKFLNGMLKKE